MSGPRLVMVFVLAMVVSFAGVALAAEGDLDPTFSGDGFAVAPTGGNASGFDVAVDSEGRIVAVGRGGTPSGLVVVRYLPDGTLDPAFSGDGMVIGAFASMEVRAATDVAIDDSDRIVVVGSAGVELRNPVVARFLSDGTPDTSFSGDGIAIEHLPYFDFTFSSVAVDSAGRIVATGSGDTGDDDDFVVMRYLTDGTLDSSFSGDGIVVIDGDPDWSGGFLVVAVDSARRVVIAGPAGPAPGIYAIRLTEVGQLDPAFSSDGMVTTAVGTGTARVRGAEIDSAGRIVLAGTSDVNIQSQEKVFALRYLADGSLDPSFSGDGIATTDVTTAGDRGFGLAIDLVGNIVVVGDAGWDDPAHDDFAVLRYLSDGSLDASFSGDGIVTTDWGSGSRLFGAAIDQFGDIVVTGDADVGSGRSLMVGRYQGAGWFRDDTDSVFADDIDWIAVAGITSGCNPPANDEFCPGKNVNRGQMAAFLHRALGDTVVPTGDPIDFTDDDASIFATDIAWLSATGITRGCTTTEYCPSKPVTRGQMAAFLVRAMGYTDVGSGDLFGDDDDSIFEADIDKLATAGVTLGCNPPLNSQFCPAENVTRGQMAAFLRRALEG